MTTIELESARAIIRIAHELNKISELKEKEHKRSEFIKLTPSTYFRKEDIREIIVIPEDKESNRHGGRINIRAYMGQAYETEFKTPEEVLALLGD